MSIGDARERINTACEQLDTTHVSYQGVKVDEEHVGRFMVQNEAVIDELGVIGDSMRSAVDSLEELAGRYQAILGELAVNAGNARTSAEQAVTSSVAASDVTRTATSSLIEVTNGTQNPRLVSVLQQALALHDRQDTERAQAVTSTVDTFQDNLGGPRDDMDAIEGKLTSLRLQLDTLATYIPDMHRDNDAAVEAAIQAHDAHDDALTQVSQLASDGRRATGQM